MVEISLICTVYNEGESVRDLLESIVNQTRKPDEAVFVDAGSNDGTREIIENYSEEHDWIKLIVEEGCNIAEGRNIAIENAENNYIVGTDGGCVLDEEWCEAMENAFEEGYKALSGLWRPNYTNTFEFVQGQIRGQYIQAGNIPSNWPPSSRSVGFTRKVWDQAGKYPEHLYTGEDSKYNSNVRRAGFEWRVVDEAWVEWDMRSTWKAYFKQFYLYGEGDAKAGNLFDYPGKILGISKVFWRLSFTTLGLIGIPLALVHPAFLGLLLIGFGLQYALKLPSLKLSAKQKGLKTVPYWLVMMVMESVAHWTGYMKESLQFYSIDEDRSFN